MNVTVVPAVQKLGFYARLTDLDGTYKFLVRIVKLETANEEVVAAAETDSVTVSENRLGIIELALNFPPIPFPSLGLYEFQLFSNQMYIGRAVLNVVKVEEA